MEFRSKTSITDNFHYVIYKCSKITLALALALVHRAFNRMHPNRSSCLNLSANGSTGDIQIHMVLPKVGIQFRMVPKVSDSICSRYISTFTCQQQERQTSLCSEVPFNISSKNSPKQGSACSCSCSFSMSALTTPINQMNLKQT